MSLTLSMEIEGLDAVVQALREIQGAAQQLSAKSVELLSVAREEGDRTNAQILRYLDEQGREFRQIGRSEAQRVAKRAAAELENEIKKLLKKANSKSKSKRGAAGRATAARMVSGAKGEDVDKLAAQQTVRVMRAAMRELMKIVREHIENQTGPDGARLNRFYLTDEYEEYKERRWGFTYPIGKRSGQLLENLNESVSSGKIRVK